MSRWETPSSAHVSVDKVCALLHQAYRGLRLYPVDHPSARQAVDALIEAVDAHVSARGPLVLQVEEDRLLYEEQPVYSFSGSRDNLAFLLFRDGIRSVSFFPGLEATELDTFVNCLAHADDLAAIEHDLATAFWEQDFIHIDYQVADPFLGGEVLREGTIDVLRETVLRRLDEVASAAGLHADSPGSVLRPVAPLGLDLGTLALTPTEMEQGERAVAEGLGVLEDFGIVLLELAGDESPARDESPGREEARPAGHDPALVGSLAAVVGRHLEDRDLDALNDIIDRLRALERTGRRPPGFVDAVVEEALTPSGLRSLFDRGSEGKGEEFSRVERFLENILPGALPAVLELLVETDDRAARKSLLAALQMQDGVPGRYIWPLMQDPRWYVVRNAVQLMAGSPEPELPARLERLLRHADTRVRREVVRTLDSLEGSRPAAVLLKALDDEDSSVRTLAARSLSHHADAGRQAALQAHLLSGSFDARPAEEIEAFTSALAALGGEGAISVLDALWRRRYLKARATPVRVAALQALGAMSSAKAAVILTEAARSREAPVRQAAQRILRRGPGSVPRQRP
ncbi:MAG: HEAT repeat domain-containing protein [Actinomycetia bacterium]|nr:HEAT repeat domain-containing protein [Actinomycetes bacterium]